MFNLSDGVKKALILIPTQPLPARTRVALRRKHLAKLELAKAHRANFLIIGHPKSGNTWLKVMISRLYQLRYNLPESKLINTAEFARKIPEIPRLAATNGYYSYEGEVGKLLAVGAPDNPLRHKPVLFLARNPIDIAVSWYHQFTKRQSRAKQELINHWIDNPVDRQTAHTRPSLRGGDEQYRGKRPTHRLAREWRGDLAYGYVIPRCPMLRRNPARLGSPSERWRHILREPVPRL